MPRPIDVLNLLRCDHRHVQHHVQEEAGHFFRLDSPEREEG